MKNSRTSKRRPSKPNYRVLEPRQMLTSFADAPLFTGTSFQDQAEIRYVDEHTVDIQINDTLHQGVDTTNGLRLNLGGHRGSVVTTTVFRRFQNPVPESTGLTQGDNVVIDQRITDRIFVSGAEGITMLGDEGNLVQTSYILTPDSGGLGSDPNLVSSSVISSFIVGSINENISFYAAEEIQTGAGDDVFNLSNNGGGGFLGQRSLTVRAGAGDDLIRFGGQQAIGSDSFRVTTPLFQLQAYGEAGNDRFVYRDLGSGTVNGGSGFDTVDRRQSEDFFGDRHNVVVHGTTATFLGPVDINPVFSFTDTRRFAAPSGRLNSAQNTRVVIQDSVERYISSADRDTSAALVGLSDTERFVWNVNGAVTTVSDAATGDSVELINYNQFVGDRAAVDAFFITETADDLTIFNADFAQISSSRDVNQGGLDTIKHDIALEHGRVYANGFLVETDGRPDPIVVVSDALGNGLNATLGPDQTISLSGGREIKFEGNVARLTIHGSNTARDSIVVRETWAPTTINTGGGNDLLMIGSSNRDANGDLAKIRSRLTIAAGEGTDRILLNNQNDVRENPLHQLSENGASVGSLTGGEAAFSRIDFGESLEIVRVNGSVTQSNSFLVTPSNSTTIVVNGGTAFEETDSLSVNAESGTVQQLAGDPSTGLYQANFGLPIYFFSVEETNVISSSITDVDFDTVFV